MKNILSIVLFLLGVSVLAQEAGRAGELLKNELQTQDIKNPVARSSENRNSNPNDNVRRNNHDKRPIRNSASDFRWNHNYGNSEVFLRIPENGRFTVEIGDQAITNTVGKFRFFDLRAGSFPISIYENNFLLYRTRIQLNNNSRIVLDFFTDYGMYLLGNYPLQPRAYGIDEWDDIWNMPYQNQNGNWNGGIYENIMSDLEFKNLTTSIQRNTSFDKDKIAMIFSVSQNVNFTSEQIYALLKTMSFDENKLQVAKELYPKCMDKRNFHVVYEAFKFDQNKRLLSEYISRI